MWDAIKDILLSQNAAIVLVFATFLTIVCWILSKTGVLNIHTDVVSLGYANKEREIIRQQVEWIRYYWEGLEVTMPKPDNYNMWRGKYITERIYDEFVDWITFNHIAVTDAYITVKQDKIVNMVRQLTVKQEFHSPEFEKFVRDNVKKSIEMLVEIRKLYS